MMSMVQSQRMAYVRAHLLPVLESDRIFEAHRNDIGFVEGIVRFFREIEERYQVARNNPTPLLLPTDYDNS